MTEQRIGTSTGLKRHARIGLLLTLIAILLIPGGILTRNVTADSGPTAADLQTALDQQQQNDPEAPVGSTSSSMSMDGMSMSDSKTANSLNRAVVTAAPNPDSPQSLAALSNATGGRWSRLASFPAGTNAYHMIMGPAGKILLIAGSGNDVNTFAAGTFKAYIWSPTTGIQKTLKVPTDMFCSGHMLMSDGRGLAAGGTTQYKPDWKGAKSLYTFDFTKETFTRQADMTHGHWYPTIIGTPGGYAIITGGYDENGKNSGTSQFYNPKTNSDTLMDGTQVFPLYPQIFSTADHRYFYTGAAWGATGRKTNDKAGIWDPFNGNKYTPVSGLSLVSQRGGAASCRIGDARNQDIMIMGGGWPATNTTALINLNSATPAYRAAPNLPAAKSYVSCIDLPDGTTLELGGGTANKIESASREVSLLTSAQATAWQPMNPMPAGEHRLYHSIAYLADDGSVITFGSNPDGEARSNSVLRYEPAYMFKGARPTISSVPASMTYGKTYAVKVSAGVTKVALESVPSPTHSSDDPNQKQITLPVVNGKITLDFKDVQFAREYIRVYALNAKGVPSTAAWSRIQ